VKLNVELGLICILVVTDMKSRRRGCFKISLNLTCLSWIRSVDYTERNYERNGVLNLLRTFSPCSAERLKESVPRIFFPEINCLR
jgi:hypothetical protein